ARRGWGERAGARALPAGASRGCDAVLRRAVRRLTGALTWRGPSFLPRSRIAGQREPFELPIVDVLAPSWCAPVYARMRGIGRIIDSPFAHGELALGRRRALARELRAAAYTRALILPNSFKSALIPWFARIPRRIGYAAEGRAVSLTDSRRIDRDGGPRMVDRFVAPAAPAGGLVPGAPAPVLVADAVNAAAAVREMGLSTRRPVAILCPGAEYGPAKRWPSEHFIGLSRRLLDAGYAVWLLGSASDQPAAVPIAAA